MDWERIKRKLEPIINTPIKLSKLSLDEWNTHADTQSASTKMCKSVLMQGQHCFLLEVQSGIASVLIVENASLTPSERQLIELVLDAYLLPERTKQPSSASEEEKTAQLVNDWVDRELALGISEAILPESLANKLSLVSTQIPLLLYGGYSDSHHVSYKDLKKLLASFFEADISLIPLSEKEWLIYGPESVLTASQGEDKESVEDALTSICSGLYEMLANEWVGECHLTIQYPQEFPTKSLLSVIVEMRETMRLGKMFYPSDTIHLPWKMRMEKLLNVLTEAEQQRFVNQVLKRPDQLPDTEMYVLLEQFFAYDCNVSETAKSLYIHRNTLLYRLDKFKQETGLDVRSFGDAVLVQVALLLYKVTKRK
jgi:sugar diacid utilization regulator